MRENFLLLMSLLIMCSCRGGRGESHVIEVVAPQLRVSPAVSEDLELCYSVKVPEGKLNEVKKNYILATVGI